MIDEGTYYNGLNILITTCYVENEAYIVKYVAYMSL